MNKNELGKLGMKEVSIYEFAKEGKLNRAVLFKAGGYYGQTVDTILKTKVYDISNNKFCFWAHRRCSKLDKVRNFFATNCFAGYPHINDEKKPHYILMTYTDSTSLASDSKNSELNPKKKESMDEFLIRMKKEIRNYTIKENCQYIKYFSKEENEASLNSYPENMFPEIVKDDKNIDVGYWITEFMYAKENVTRELLEECFIMRKMNGLSQKNARCKSPASTNIFVNFNPDKLDKLRIKYSDNNKYNNNSWCIIAKIEYPYIVHLKSHK